MGATRSSRSCLEIMMEPFVKIIFKVAKALKAQHCNELLKITGKREMEKSDIAKLYEKGKDKTEGTDIFI